MNELSLAVNKQEWLDAYSAASLLKVSIRQIRRLFDRYQELLQPNYIKIIKSRGRNGHKIVISKEGLTILANMKDGNRGNQHSDSIGTPSVPIQGKKKIAEAAIQKNTIIVGEETSKFFNNLIEAASIFSPTAKITLAAAISEQVYGIKVPYLSLPPANIPRKTATEIASELGCSSKLVGAITNALNLKRPPYGDARLSKALNSNKEVSVYYYNEEAQQRIKEYYDKKMNLDL